MQGCLSSPEKVLQFLISKGMTATPHARPAGSTGRLDDRARRGRGPHRTRAPGRLHGRHLLARAARGRRRGRRSARPDVVVTPRDGGGRRRGGRDRRRAPHAGRPLGRRAGTQGGASRSAAGSSLDLTAASTGCRGRRALADRDGRGGRNGRELEAELNERGLMLPHYPASAEWATVGGYVAARGSGVLSTRYGKIEDLLLRCAWRCRPASCSTPCACRATPSGPS